MIDNKWRFPASNHGKRKGISSGDSETFKKAPYEAFAREIIQNSIDVPNSDEEPVIVEFQVFDMKVSDIPGIGDLKSSLNRCKTFWKHKDDYVEEIDYRSSFLNQETIKCLRVSDFNTTGLVGINSDEYRNNQFLALVKGTGVSEKPGEVSGGSKGVGKNAAFLMSSIKTVFYATNACKTIDDTPGSFKGSFGVADFESGYVCDDISINDDHTQGEGFYSKDDYNRPIEKVLSFDKNFSQRENEFGTDVFILGFSDSPSWDKEIINSILNSFMASIVRGRLEIIISGQKINKDTVEDYIYDDTIINKGNKPSIVSQYRILSGKYDVIARDVDTEYGSCALYILPFSKEEEQFATHKCSMIRHPLMKIKDIDLGSNFRVSAMCIIGNDKLGKVLRKIENPQHIGWETSRIKDPSERKDMNLLLKDLKMQILDYVIDCLKLGDDKPIDPPGAGDYIPDEDTGEYSDEKSKDMTPGETVSVSPIKENIPKEKNANKEADDGNGLEPDIGSINEDEDGNVEYPDGENEGQGGGSHSGEQTGEEKPGDSIIFKRAKLAGVRYKYMALNKHGLIRVIFTSPIDFEKCYLCINMLDDAGSPENVSIKEMKCNGSNVISTDSKEFGPFEIKTNEKIVLDVNTDVEGYFASEVKIICK